MHPNSLANLKPFKPGQSGNPSGRPKQTFPQLVEQELRKRSDEDPEKSKLEVLAQDYVQQLLDAGLRDRRDYLSRVWPEVKQTQITGMESAELRFHWAGDDDLPVPEEDEPNADDA